MDENKQQSLQEQYEQLIGDIKEQYSDDTIAKYNELAYSYVDEKKVDNIKYSTNSSSYGNEA